MITIEKIYEKTTEEQILKHYFPSFDGKFNKNYISPFSDSDDKPSLNFYQKNNKIMYKSHNTGHQGDVFQFVADLKKLDCRTNMPQLLETINTDLNLNITEQITKKNIGIVANGYSEKGLLYWQQFGVKAETLYKYNVQEVKTHSFINNVGKFCKFDYHQLNKIAFCYNIDKRIKIYIPALPVSFGDDLLFQGQTKSFGFKDQSSADVFGLAQLPKGRIPFIIFSAGEKDCLSLNAHGFNAISMQSENQLPQADLIVKLKEKTDHFFVCYDNDTAGINSAKKIKDTFGIPSIILPNEIKDVADYFTKFKAADYQKLVDNAMEATKEQEKQKTAELQANKTIFHRVENYLKAKYDFRYNSIKHDIEFSLKSLNTYEPVNENSLYIELMKNGLSFSMANLIAILKSEFVPKYNPLEYYFENLKPWQPTDFDFIDKLASYIDCGNDQAEWTKHFKKWLVRAAACAVVPNYYNKQALILVHQQQNSGKSTFCRFLCPQSLKDYIAEDITDDKDSRILLTKNFIINLDELSSLARKEINSLKSLFSKDKINERLPYDKKNSIIDRVCSFIGSTNMSEFLADETGSVRWLCFNIKDINWKYAKEVNMDDVWAQAYSLFKSGNFEYNLTGAEIKENEARNNKFQVLSTEAELIPKFFIHPTDEISATFMTATDILLHLQHYYQGLRLNKIMIGKGLVMNGFQRVKDSKSDRYGFLVHQIMPSMP
ncbi:MAG: VapE domain-containing protein [Bacteroidota bacterium]